MKLLQFLFAIFLSDIVFGQSNLHGCYGSDISKWNSCSGIETLGNGDKYVGEYWNGKRHGQGTFYFLANNKFKGDRFLGYWKDGKKNGLFTYIYSNGESDVNEYKDDMKNGHGTYTSEYGDKYVGEFKDGKRNGQGTYTRAYGDKYVGEYKDDKWNGQGTYLDLNCDKYVGEWKDGQMHGRGIKTYQRGDKYAGEWVNGSYNGQGVLTKADGTRFEGIFKRNKFIREENVNPSIFNTDISNSTEQIELDIECQRSANERRKIELAKLQSDPAYRQSNLPTCSGINVSEWNKCNGEEVIKGTSNQLYRGEYLNGKKHGFGGIYDHYPQWIGDKYLGQFKDDKFNGQGTYYHLSNDELMGNKYVGGFKDGKKDGKGTYTWSNGDKYVGEYKDDKRNGQGTYTWPNGNKYVGELKDGKYNGQGIFKFSNGAISLGEWIEGKAHGQFIEYRSDKTIQGSGIYKDGKLVTYQLIDPNRFTRLNIEKNELEQLQIAIRLLKEKEKINEERLAVEEASRKKDKLELSKLCVKRYSFSLEEIEQISSDFQTDPREISLERIEFDERGCVATFYSRRGVIRCIVRSKRGKLFIPLYSCALKGS